MTDILSEYPAPVLDSEIGEHLVSFTILHPNDDVEHIWMGADALTRSAPRYQYTQPSFSQEQRHRLECLASQGELVVFNSGFETAVLSAAIAGYTSAEIFEVVQAIIVENIHPRQVLRQRGLKWPNWQLIDVMALAPAGSLKALSARAGAESVAEYDFEQGISVEHLEAVQAYCLKDCQATRHLRSLTAEDERTRRDIGEEIGSWLLSTPVASIAERRFLSLYLRHPLNPGDADAQDIAEQARNNGSAGDVFEYAHCPKWLKAFAESDRASTAFKDIFTRLTSRRYILLPGRKIVMTEFAKLLKSGADESALVRFAKNSKLSAKEGLAVRAIDGELEPMGFAGLAISLGLGGCHSIDLPGHFSAECGYSIQDWDVSSMYPSLQIRGDIFPRHLDTRTCRAVFTEAFNRRIEAKRSGDVGTAAREKLLLNSLFGKTGLSSSSIYDPRTLLGVTITGQLSILALADRLQQSGAILLSLNTDGVTFALEDGHPREGIDAALTAWQASSGMTLESQNYRTLARTSVSDYVAIRTDGKLKTIGAFTTSASLSKSASMPIVAQAVIAVLSGKAESVADVVEAAWQQKDIQQFIGIRSGEGVFRQNGKFLGKVVRSILSTQPQEPIVSAKGTRLDASCQSRPIASLSEPCEDLNVAAYVALAEQMLSDIGEPVQFAEFAIANTLSQQNLPLRHNGKLLPPGALLAGSQSVYLNLQRHAPSDYHGFAVISPALLESFGFPVPDEAVLGLVDGDLLISKRLTPDIDYSRLSKKAEKLGLSGAMSPFQNPRAVWREPQSSPEILKVIHEQQRKIR